MKKLLFFGITALQMCSLAPLLAQGSGAILKPDALNCYVATFKSQRSGDTAADLLSDGSTTAFINNQSSTWIEHKVPLFECSDNDIKEAYHCRWRDCRKHLCMMA